MHIFRNHSKISPKSCFFWVLTPRRKLCFLPSTPPPREQKKSKICCEQTIIFFYFQKMLTWVKNRKTNGFHGQKWLFSNLFLGVLLGLHKNIQFAEICWNFLLNLLCNKQTPCYVINNMGKTFDFSVFCLLFDSRASGLWIIILAPIYNT